MNPITKLTIELSKQGRDAKQVLSSICQTIKTAVPNADRVSIWLFDKDKTEIFCLMCNDENSETSNGMSLSRELFQAYFNFVLENKVLNASFAREDDRTSCFNEHYFEPLNIYSLLDYTFHQDLEPVGVICCEHVGKEIVWTDEDASNLTRVSKVTSMFFAEQIASKGNKQGILDYIYN